ncbi:MAG: ABC transporter permease [Hyphomicrobiales bacterium]|nr:ABC transporter permease [Hyphomicrobiales bacterium]
MAANLMEPAFTTSRAGELTRLALSGDWTVAAGRTLEKQAAALGAAAQGAQRVAFDFANIGKLDTAGAWVIDAARQKMAAQSASENLSPDMATLMHAVGWRDFNAGRAPPPPQSALYDSFVDVGESVVEAGHDAYTGVAFLGETVASLSRAVLHPAKFRLTSLVYHMENFGLRSTPIILLINFLVGGIVAQQGIFQLRYFGAETFAVDLIGILILRELGVLLTSIMIAGRSGSAIAAELGSMKMREEIDALKVMGMRPMDVLVTPRVLALILVMPLLNFLADMAAIFGGMVVSWIYAGLSPDAFLSRLQVAIGLNTFMVGMIKAPFMAMVIGVIGAMEGLAVEGSAESLGRQVTSSVVKSIFMVILVDGLFAIFFASIDY